MNKRLFMLGQTFRGFRICFSISNGGIELSLNLPENCKFLVKLEKSMQNEDFIYHEIDSSF